MLEQLHPGASEEELVRAEATLGVTFPEDFKASYRIHNGGGRGLLTGMQGGFCSLDQVVEVWSMFQHISEQESGWAETPPGFMSDPGRERPPIQPVWWQRNVPGKPLHIWLLPSTPCKLAFFWKKGLEEQ